MIEQSAFLSSRHNAISQKFYETKYFYVSIVYNCYQFQRIKTNNNNILQNFLRATWFDDDSQDHFFLKAY